MMQRVLCGLPARPPSRWRAVWRTLRARGAWLRYAPRTLAYLANGVLFVSACTVPTRVTVVRCSKGAPKVLVICFLRYFD